MLSDCSVVLSHENCDWTGDLVLSHVQRRGEAEIGPTDQAWFRCPRCQHQWEVRVTDDALIVLPAVEPGDRIAAAGEAPQGPWSEFSLRKPGEAPALCETV